MREGYEGGIDIRRDDGTLDTSINVLGRNGEIHVTIGVDGATYSLANIVVDLRPEEAHELAGALKDAAAAAGPREAAPPMSVGGDKWTAEDVADILGERR